MRAPDGEEKGIFETPSANCGKGKENSEVSSLSDEKTVAAPVPDREGGKPAVPQKPPAKEREPDFFKAQANKGAEERASEERASEEDLYRAACNSEAVRLRIIGDYLASLRSADAPLMRGGTAVFTAPPSKRNDRGGGNGGALLFQEGQVGKICKRGESRRNKTEKIGRQTFSKSERFGV